jgi:hypothetical protein
LTSGVEVSSCPPTISSPKAGRATVSKRGRAVTRPVRSLRSSLRAAIPTIVVVATEPRAPMNHTPVVP